MKLIDKEDKILTLVKQFGYIRRNKLLEDLNKGISYSKIDKSNNFETSYSEPFIIAEKKKKGKVKKVKVKTSISLPTFNRILERMVRLEKIKNLRYPAYERLGIFDKDKKASYITLHRTYELIEYYDKVLKQATTGDYLKRKNALIEIESMMTDIIFTPEQLTILSDLLNKRYENREQNKLGENIVRILFFSLDKRKLIPADIERLQRNLIDYYKNNEGNITQGTKASIIYILGLFNNRAVIDFLKKDVGQWHKNAEELLPSGYNSWTIAKILDDNQEELFNFQNTLGEEDSKTIFTIRTQGKNSLSYYSSVYPEYEKKIEAVENRGIEIELNDQKKKNKK